MSRQHFFKAREKVKGIRPSASRNEFYYLLHKVKKHLTTQYTSSVNFKLAYLSPYEQKSDPLLRVGLANYKEMAKQVDLRFYPFLNLVNKPATTPNHKEEEDGQLQES